MEATTPPHPDVIIIIFCNYFVALDVELSLWADFAVNFHIFASKKLFFFKHISKSKSV